MAFGLAYTHPGGYHTINPIWTVYNGLGAFGVKETLRKMAQYAKSWAVDRNIREAAENIVTQAGASDDYRMQAEAIHNWMRDNIKYLAQPVGFQQLKSPGDLLHDKIGVCTDIATLQAALLRSIGIDARFEAVSFAPSEELSHVFVQVPLGTVWVTSDATPIKDERGATVAQLAFGEEAPGIAVRKIQNVK
jgi:transglutaminase-like putative cysteine protease